MFLSAGGFTGFDDTFIDTMNFVIQRFHSMSTWLLGNPLFLIGLAIFVIGASIGLVKRIIN